MTDRPNHIEEIERVLAGAQSDRDPIVLESWARCVADYGLDPARPGEAYILPDTQLRIHREQSERLVSIARSGVETLFRQVAGQNYVLLLTDAEGVTVDFFGDPSFERELRAAGLYLGAEWSEERAGTCGVGACIHSGEALTIHQSDHFDITHIPLSCTAAPIYDAAGRLTAVLDISLLRSPQPKASQRLALHLVTAAARRIELANLTASMRKEWILRLSRSPEFLDVDPEAAVALDGSGRILGMTHGAARAIAQTGLADWRHPETLIGKPISAFFDLTMDDLPGLTGSRPAQERAIYLRDGAAIFAHGIEPPRRTFRSAGEADLPRALKMLSGDDAAQRTLQRQAAKLAHGALPILLRGETGTGKERYARAIHAARPRAGPFVAINCAAIPESLIEGELFGHEAGAFTGALAGGRKGLIESANGGVLFLDEIGDMPLHLQARLLRVVSEGEVMRLGGARARRVSLKVISATHRDLATLVREGTFRADLFYRLAAATLTIPPLRARRDFDWLIERILEERGLSGLMLSSAARAALARHDWPGNIRELAHALEVAAALCENGVVEAVHLGEPLLHTPSPPVRARQIEASTGDGARLAALLEACGGNVSEAARRLGVDRGTLHRRIRRYGLRKR